VRLLLLLLLSSPTRAAGRLAGRCSSLQLLNST